MSAEIDIERLWLDGEEIGVSWARLGLRRQVRRAATRAPATWAIAATLGQITFFDEAEVRVRAELETGEVLEGCGVLHESAGWGIWLTSQGPWTGIAGWVTTAPGCPASPRS